MSSKYKAIFKRRREGKTDYHSRKRLILSRLPRLVVRGSNKHTNIQLVDAKPGGDFVLASSHSSDLVKDFGWRGSCGNLSVAYLTGLLIGYRASSRGVKRAVLDVGLQTPSRGARVFAAVKGVLDAGLEVSCDREMLPNESRLRGEHVANYASKLSNDPERYKRVFSDYLAKGLKPEELPKHFDQVKKLVVEGFAEGGKRVKK